jgi:hypothetical protein
MGGNQQHAVHVSPGKEFRSAALFALSAGEDEDQRDVMDGQGVRRPAQEDREIGVLEQTVMGFGQQERHRVSPVGRQVPGMGVDPVARLLDGGVDGFKGGRADPVSAVQHPGNRAARDPGFFGHVVDLWPRPGGGLRHGSQPI